MNVAHGTIVLGVLFVASACATSIRVPPLAAVRTAVPVAASYDRTWEAVVSYFADRNIPIRTIEKASGIIVAEPAAAYVKNREPFLNKKGKIEKGTQGPPVYADCGGPAVESKGYVDDKELFQWDPSAAIYNLRVLGDATKSTVQANVRYVTWRGDLQSAMREPYQCSSTGKWETEIEAYIRQYAEAGK